MGRTAVAIAILASACGGNAPAAPTPPVVASAPSAPPPAPAGPAELAPPEPVEPPAAAAAAAPLPAPPPASRPMSPGIHPVLAFTRALEGPRAFLLACVQIIPRKPTKFLGGTTCARLLRKVDLELVLDSERITVTLGARASAVDCPWADASKKLPTFKLGGLPAEREGAQFIVSKGTVENRGEVPPDAMLKIRANAPLQPTKRGTSGPTVTTQFDLDGDGSFEVIMSMGGDDLEIFRADGTSFGKVGCYFG